MKLSGEMCRSMLLLCVWSLPVLGQIVYVDGDYSGSTPSDGSAAFPYKTLHEARNVVSAEQKIVVKPSLVPYNQTDLLTGLPHNVEWHFESGAKIIHTGNCTCYSRVSEWRAFVLKL